MAVLVDGISLNLVISTWWFGNDCHENIRAMENEIHWKAN